jgi:hypothetical protein
MALTRTLTFNLTATLKGTITSTEVADGLNFTLSFPADPGNYQVRATAIIPPGGSQLWKVTNPELTQVYTEGGELVWEPTLTTQDLLTITGDGSVTDVSVSEIIIDE